MLIRMTNARVEQFANGFISKIPSTGKFMPNGSDSEV